MRTSLERLWSWLIVCLDMEDKIRYLVDILIVPHTKYRMMYVLIISGARSCSITSVQLLHTCSSVPFLLTHKLPSVLYHIWCYICSFHLERVLQIADWANCFSPVFICQCCILQCQAGNSFSSLPLYYFLMY